jgi:hypothetical protein
MAVAVTIYVMVTELLKLEGTTKVNEARKNVVF